MPEPDGSLGPTDLAILSARADVQRCGASRANFCPEDVEGVGTSEPGEYVWKEYFPPTTQWTLLTPGRICGQLPIADFDYSGEVTPEPEEFSVTWTVEETDSENVGESEIYTFAPVIVGGVGPYTFLWDFSDLNPSSLENPIHVWDRNGWSNPSTISVTLTVTDDLSDTAVFTDDVVVQFNE